MDNFCLGRPYILKLGTLGSVETAMLGLNNVGVTLDKEAGQITRKVYFSNTMSLINIVLYSSAQLGCTGGHTTRDVVECAHTKFDVVPCKPEVATQIWLQYQLLIPNGKFLLVAMEPVCDDKGAPNIYELLCKGGGQRRLKTQMGSWNKLIWPDDYQTWAFEVP